jgi:hypothetical protein
MMISSLRHYYGGRADFACLPQAGIEDFCFAREKFGLLCLAVLLAVVKIAVKSLPAAGKAQSKIRNN